MANSATYLRLYRKYSSKIKDFSQVLAAFGSADAPASGLNEFGAVGGAYLDTTYTGISALKLPMFVLKELAYWDTWKKRTEHALLSRREIAPQIHQDEQPFKDGKIDVEAVKRATKALRDRPAKVFDAEKLATRIHYCGASLLMMASEEDEKTLAMSARCDSAACPHCARLISQERSRLVAEKLQQHSPRDLRMMTLTVKNCSVGDLSGAIDKIYRAFKYFKEFEKNPEWSNRVKGYIWNFEVTFNEVKREWHPHFHVVYHGRFFPLRLAAAAWQKACDAVGLYASKNAVSIEALYWKDPKSGLKVPIKNAESFEFAALEISKYNVKPLEMQAIRDEDIFELLQAFFNRRRFGTHGTLSIADLKKKKSDDAVSWKKLGSFRRLETLGYFSGDEDIYKRTLFQLFSDPSSYASIVRSHPKLSRVAAAISRMSPEEKRQVKRLVCRLPDDPAEGPPGGSTGNSDGLATVPVPGE